MILHRTLAALIGLALLGAAHGCADRAASAGVSASELSELLRPHDELLLPEGEGPFPIVIQFHGCGGKSGAQRDWAQRIRELGFAVLSVDSMAPRGLARDAVCGGRALLPRERAGDVLVSLDHVRRLPRVDPRRIVLAGWSHGAVAVIQLLALDPPAALPTGLDPATRLGLEGVAGIVLFYPYCGVEGVDEVWKWRAPGLFLLAGEDAIAPAERCTALASALRGAGHAVDVQVYPGAQHGFDARERPATYDREATADAVQRVRAFLMGLARGSDPEPARR